MKKNNWLTIGIVLALAIVMLWAIPSSAQMRGKNQGGQGWGCGGQGQGQGMGYGATNGTCPNYQGSQNGQGNWSNTPQAYMGRRGNRGGGRNYQFNPQLNPQPSAPNVTQ